MELTVLGRYGPYPRPGGACSGYVLTDGAGYVLMDCGPGTVSRLLEQVPLGQLRGVVLSHLHFDHCSDMGILRYALEQLGEREGGVLPLPVYAPTGPTDVANALLKGDVLDVRHITPGTQAVIGGMTFDFYQMAHPVPTFGMMVTGGDGAKLFYTGDTGYFDALPELCRGADALLADTCFVDADDNGKPLAHLTAGQAGGVAEAAGAGRLLCTHLWGGADRAATVEKEVDMPGAVVVQELGHYVVLPYEYKKEE